MALSQLPAARAQHLQAGGARRAAPAPARAGAVPVPVSGRAASVPAGGASPSGRALGASPLPAARARAAAAAAAALREAEPAETRVGFLGLGIMGAPMALNLVRAGFAVTVWNRTPERCDALAAAGAAVGASPAAVAAASDVVFAMLADPAAAREVALGPGGAVEGLSPGKGYIDASTVDAATAAAVAAAVRATGAAFLEAPVSGSKAPAEQGKLIFLASGDEELFEAARPLLGAMGKASVFLGARAGDGARLKLVVNQARGAARCAHADRLHCF